MYVCVCNRHPSGNDTTGDGEPVMKVLASIRGQIISDCELKVDVVITKSNMSTRCKMQNEWGFMDKH